MENFADYGSPNIQNFVDTTADQMKEYGLVQITLLYTRLDFIVHSTKPECYVTEH